MNKYEKALHNLRQIEQTENTWDVNSEVLQELVNKATPKKPETSGDSFENGILILDTWYCPNCDENFDIDYNRYEYCPCCGQAIDNSELDEMR